MAVLELLAENKDALPACSPARAVLDHASHSSSLMLNALRRASMAPCNGFPIQVADRMHAPGQLFHLLLQLISQGTNVSGC